MGALTAFTGAELFRFGRRKSRRDATDHPDARRWTHGGARCRPPYSVGLAMRWALKGFFAGAGGRAGDAGCGIADCAGCRP